MNGVPFPPATLACPGSPGGPGGPGFPGGPAGPYFNIKVIL